MKRLTLIAALGCAFVAATATRAPAESKAADTKEEYVKKARVELDRLSAQIDDLEVQVKNAGDSGHEGLDQSIKDLKARRKTANKSFSRLKRAGGKAWLDLKAGVDKSLADLQDRLDKARKD